MNYKAKKTLFIFALLCATHWTQAQWRAGITAGADWNQYTIDKHYMLDWHYEAQWGITFGVTGQYDVNNWLALRTDVSYAQKNHRQYRTGYLKGIDYNSHNAYLQVPVMASFGFGGEKVRGFLNLGMYGGYWLTSRVVGSYYNLISEDALGLSEAVFDVDEKNGFNSKRDQRWDFGPTCGLGVECRFARHWAAQLETRCYYSTVSTQKDYMQLKDPKYNTTIGLQAAIIYIFEPKKNASDEK